MTKSALQIARAAYQPKLPKALKGSVKAVEGAATQSVADQRSYPETVPEHGMQTINSKKVKLLSRYECRCYPFREDRLRADIT